MRRFGALRAVYVSLGVPQQAGLGLFKAIEAAVAAGLSRGAGAAGGAPPAAV